MADIDLLFDLTCQVFNHRVRKDTHVYSAYIALSTLNIILSIITVAGNILIIVSLRKETSLHPPTKLLFRCLASTDLGVGLVVQPFFVVYLMAVAVQDFRLCRNALAIFYYAASALVVISLLILVFISVDRLLALSLGLRYRQVVTVKRVYIVILSTWLLVIAHSIIIYLWNSSIVYFSLWPGIIAMVCVVMSAFAYAKILLALRRQQAQVQAHLNSQQVNGNARQLKKTISAVIWVLVSMIGCHTPSSTITVLIGKNISLLNVMLFFWDIAGTLLYLSSTLNPIIYCWRMANVRQATKDTIRQVLCLEQ